MQYSFARSCLVALAAVSGVVAQTAGFDAITNPITPGTTVPAGETFDITWDPSPAPLNGKISIVLLQGKTNTTLEAGDTIASGIDGSKGTYAWDVSKSTPKFDTYGLKLILDSQPTTFQYSTYFSISGLDGSSSGGSSSASSSSAAASSSGGSTSPTSTSTVKVSAVSTSVTVTTSTSSSAPTTSSKSTSSVPFTNTTLTSTKTAATGSGSGAGGSETGSGTSTGPSSTGSAAATQTPNAAIAGAAVSGGLMSVIFVALGLIM